MFGRLQKKWKVGGLQLVLILCTFAIGGSLTGYTGRKLMNLFDIGSNGVWIAVYIILITLLWPLAVLLVSVPFGQFRFFTGYLRKVGTRMGLIKSKIENRKSKIGHSPSPVPQQSDSPSVIHHPSSVIQMAIFASGAGSNARKIIEYFAGSATVKIALVVCNNPAAGVLDIAKEKGIPVLLIEKEQFFRGNGYTDELKAYDIRFIVLAGFLWKLPEKLIRAYPGRIVNIHPALLPAYGGKGMYGNKVHEAVIAAGDKESGISIHYVDEQYDHGSTIFQARCAVLENDTPSSLAERIHQLEHEHYPRVIAELVAKL